MATEPCSIHCDATQYATQDYNAGQAKRHQPGYNDDDDEDDGTGVHFTIFTMIW